VLVVSSIVAAGLRHDWRTCSMLLKRNDRHVVVAGVGGRPAVTVGRLATSTASALGPVPCFVRVTVPTFVASPSSTESLL
jgi:hypothetical protein